MPGSRATGWRGACDSSDVWSGVRAHFKSSPRRRPHTEESKRRRRVRNRLFCVVCASALLLSLPASARPLAAIKADGTLRVGLTGDYAPYSLRGTDGTINGADVIMAQSLAKSLGVKLTIVPTAWKTMKSDLVGDKFDVAMGGVSV